MVKIARTPGLRSRKKHGHPVRPFAAACLAALVAGCGGDGAGGSSLPLAATYAVGGTVSGLAGSGLTLKNGSDTLAVNGNGSFILPTRVASGAGYAVTVGTQPGTPAQTCTVQYGTGTVASADVTTVAVGCTTTTSTVAYAAVPHTASDAGMGAVEYFAYDPATGRLTLRSAARTAADTYVFYVKATPSGHQLLVSTSTLVDRANATLRDDLSLYDLSTSTGAPTRSGLLASPGGGDLVVHPNGTDLYAPGTTLRHFSLAAGAAPGQALALGTQPGLSSAITPDGKFLFVPTAGQDGGTAPSITVVSLANPQQPQLATRVATPIRPLTATISPDGTLLYVTPIDAGDAGYVYRIGASGSLAQAGTFAVPSYARSGVIVASGNYLYLASSDANKVQGYRLDGSGGATPLDGGVTVPAAFRLASSPDGKYLYVISTPVSGALGAIYGFAIGADGRLTPVPGSPVMTGEREYDLTFATVGP